MSRFVRVLLVAVAAFLILVIIGVVVLNGTYYGRERVRRLALDAVRGIVHGEVIVGRIDGNLLDRFDLIDVSILDQDGQPFLIADRVRARIALAPLLSRRIIVRALELDHPVVTLSRTAGGRWNYQRIFGSGDTTTTDVKLGFGSWIDLHGITIRNGTLLVHQPYPGDEAVRRGPWRARHDSGSSASGRRYGRRWSSATSTRESRASWRRIPTAPPLRSASGS